MTSVAEPVELEFQTGDRMSREEFHRIYSQMPEGFRAELIGGIVYVASPLKRRHGTNHLPLGTLFFTYEARTPGVESGDNTTILLGDEGEPQPDLFLRILPEFHSLFISHKSGNTISSMQPFVLSLLRELFGDYG